MNDRTALSGLAAAALGGQEEAYDALVRALWPNAYRIAWSILRERCAAQDAAQAACAAICAKLQSLSDVRAFAGWSTRIIVSNARDHARARSRLQRREAVGYETASGVSTRDEPIARLDLEAAIAMMPDSLRLPLELHYFVGLTSGEVGVALGIPAATVRFRLMIARHRLRPLLCDSTAPATAQETIS
jgi:RNA polymerase sigma factor (sigma-70 family)